MGGNRETDIDISQNLVNTPLFLPLLGEIFFCVFINQTENINPLHADFRRSESYRCHLYWLFRRRE